MIRGVCIMISLLISRSKVEGDVENERVAEKKEREADGR